MKVRIFIESSLKGPGKRDGVAMWLVEYMKGEIPITREGFIHLENGTEAQVNLMAAINAFFILKKSCSVLVFTKCEHILNTIQNRWHIQWKKNGWRNAKGKEIKNAKLWEMLEEKMDPHDYVFEKCDHDYANYMNAAVQKEFERWKEKK